MSTGAAPLRIIYKPGDPRGPFVVLKSAIARYEWHQIDAHRTLREALEKYPEATAAERAIREQASLDQLIAKAGSA